MSLLELGEAVRNRRKELGITQPVLAELSGLSKNTIYKLERGQGNPTAKVLLGLLDVLGLDLSIRPKSVEL